MSDEIEATGNSQSNPVHATELIVHPNASALHESVSEPSSPRDSNSRKWYQELKTPITLLAALPLVFLVGHFALQMRASSVMEQLEQETRFRERKANAELKLAALQQAELLEKEAIAVATSQIDEALAKVASTKATLAQFKSNVDRLHREKAELLSGELGRRVLSSPALLEDAEAFWLTTQSQPLPSSLDLEQRLDHLESSLSDAKSNITADFDVSHAMTTTIDTAKIESNRLLKSAEEQLASLDSIREQAMVHPVSADLSTLSVALEQKRLEQLRKEQKEALQRLEETRKANEEMVLQAQIAKERAIAEEKKIGEEKIAVETAEKMRLEAQAEVAKLAGANQETRARLDKQRLEAEFNRDRSQIQSLLVAFLSDGNTYRTKEVSRGPASLTDLKSAGALNEGPDGVKMLCKIISVWNDRPRGAMPFYDGSARSWDSIDRAVPARAQELLIKYGDLLVEKRLLAP
ncbi:hypothetical protein Q31b_00920 [Novipirellula aureliae]|uniref:Uncharacterized protein n=1 Tax=Novipirellula aureliae TaxID=2527966 RepID=A0A5C6EB09_9BACT|nr:hypothetical protein [Novipirellula aureliae]TWU44921.1 hypothetical protein Q31b_00920 [Novipirellula aureliae]